MSLSPISSIRVTPLALAALLALAGCATTAPTAEPAKADAAVASAATSAAPATPVAAAAAPNAGASAPTAARPAAAPAAGAPPPFATVAKDAKESAGLIAVWRKDEKTWLELRPEDFKKTYFLSPKFATGIGENMLFGGLMAGSWAGPVSTPQALQFRRVGNQVQMIAVNTDFVAKDGSPAALAVKSAFSPSLLGSAPVASAAHPERGSVLVDASALFVSDLPGIGIALQRLYRQNYALDRGNSALTTVRNSAELLVLETLNHYASAGIAVAQPNTPPGTPVPTVPKSLPDVRSLFMTMHYSLSVLPEQPMAARKADPRLGYFQTVVSDFSDDLARSPRQRLINRWRLEKKDPAAALSEPVKPITFWLDRNIPENYRAPIAAGALEWNKAFEKIGFKNAIVVIQQPADADFDTLDVNRASIRWMTNSAPAFGAIGPSHVDPRSGEILDADIGFESLSSRARRNERTQILAASAGEHSHFEAGPHASLGEMMRCSYADHATEQLGYALDVLEARGDLDPDSPEAEAHVLAYLKDVSMHEVGHTLGLRHNFRASRVFTQAQINDPAFVASNGLTGSVMEYSPVNLAGPGQRPLTAFTPTLGPYDYWVIEYGYKPIDAKDEAAELQRIAARSAEPLLAYATDEDNYLGIDPESLQMDLGEDPIGFARKRFDIARDLFARQETRQLKANADFAVLRRSVGYALRDVGRASSVLSRQIGGVRTLRDFPGSGRDPLEPTNAAKQREALDLLATRVLAADAFKLSPSLQRRMAPDFHERGDSLGEPGGPVGSDFSLTQLLLQNQRAVLGQLMSDGVAARILDSEAKVDKPSQVFHLSELYGRLTREVWSELGASGDIPGARRELQREYVNRVSAMLLRPTAMSRADARSLLRAEAQQLRGKLQSASGRPGLSAEARAHLRDSADSLVQALDAKLVRAGA
ncbi:zinc-dependent metalloprotease [Rivibacter subsaxonicus]|uniref:Uncharacterized protein DUF5117 n=1 Tax=Rivibacter subsaxonicus TaxID=457575 RepID=A0A4Q7W1R6_9BURK|nr:zinc-dependent metalloprotease [Rivibacter subsaxonicus]RZU03110.1 uncharacterized protein DUF5117 [Rivibacter subsaxonicus]